jgi:hypothetical protein
VRLLFSDPNRLCGVFSLAGHRPQSGDGVIAEVALPRWRYVSGRGLHGRPSVRYRTCRLGAPDAVPRTARAGAITPSPLWGRWPANEKTPQSRFGSANSSLSHCRIRSSSEFL